VGQNTYTARWFDGRQLALALGLVVAFSRIGSSVNFLVTPIFATNGVPLSVWFGTGMCLISFFACVAVALLDYWGQPRITAKHDANKPPEQVNFSVILTFPLSSWLIFVICQLFYISVLTFYTAAGVIMQNSPRKYNKDVSSDFLFIPNFVAIFAAPLFGRLIDTFGYSLWALLAASAMMVIGHFCFMAMFMDWFFIHPIVLMIWIGLAYSLFASSIWPTLPNIIRESALGTAYGAMTAVQNLGLGLGPNIVGWMQEAKSITGTKWEWVLPLMFFMACAGGAFILTFFLMIVDAKFHDGVLNAPGEFKKTYQEALNSNAPLVNETSPLVNAEKLI
jgi:MFS family permease